MDSYESDGELVVLNLDIEEAQVIESVFSYEISLRNEYFVTFKPKESEVVHIGDIKHARFMILVWINLN